MEAQHASSTAAMWTGEEDSITLNSVPVGRSISSSNNRGHQRTASGGSVGKSKGRRGSNKAYASLNSRPPSPDEDENDGSEPADAVIAEALAAAAAAEAHPLPATPPQPWAQVCCFALISCTLRSWQTPMRQLGMAADACQPQQTVPEDVFLERGARFRFLSAPPSTHIYLVAPLTSRATYESVSEWCTSACHLYHLHSVHCSIRRGRTCERRMRDTRVGWRKGEPCLRRPTAHNVPPHRKIEPVPS